MKNLLLHFLFLFTACLFSFNANATKSKGLKYDSLSCLKIEGKITNADESEGECIVELIGLNQQVDTISLKEGKIRFKFLLNKDSYYAIRISKVGYITKFVCVNTEILTETNGIFSFQFETTLMREEAIEKLNKDILDFPIAIIHFDYTNDTFNYNKEYSNQIKKELYAVKASRKRHTKKETFIPLASLSN